MCLVTCFRSERVGTDTWQYLNYGAYLMTDNSDSRFFEWCSNSIYLLIDTFHWDTRVALYVFAVVTYLFLYLISRKYKVKLYYLVLFFFLGNFFSTTLNISRQMASIPIIIYALPYVFEKNQIKSLLYFVFAIIAGGFHSISYVYMAFYLFRYLNFNKHKFIILLIIIAPLFVLQILPMQTILTALTPAQYARYIGDFSTDLNVTVFGRLYALIIFSIQIYIFSKNNQSYHLVFGFSILSTLALQGLSQEIGRVFFPMLFVIYIAYADYFTNKRNPILLAGLIIGMTYFCFKGISTNPDLNHYTTYF